MKKDTEIMDLLMNVAAKTRRQPPPPPPRDEENDCMPSPPPHGNNGDFMPPPPPRGDNGDFMPPPPPRGNNGDFMPPPPPRGDNGDFMPPPPPRGDNGDFRSPPPPLPRLGLGRILVKLLNEDGITPTNLAEELNIRLPSLSEAVAKLESRGLIIRKDSLQDKRSIKLYLTDLGRETAKKRREQHEEFIVDFFNPISEDEKEQLYNILTKLLNGSETL